MLSFRRVERKWVRRAYTRDPMRFAFAIGCLFLGALAAAVSAQTPAVRAEGRVVRGLYNWVHSTADAERAFAFYRDVLGLQLAPSPFVPNAAAPEGIRPWPAVVPDELIWQLTDTKGSRARTVFMRAPNTPFGLELSEFIEIPRSERAANPWDPGASRLIFRVRDLSAVAVKLRARAAPIVTLGGGAVSARGARSMLVRDPDGYLVELRQASASEVAAAASGQIVGTSIGLTVESTPRALELYRDLLGFDVRETWHASSAELALNGLDGGRLELTRTAIPGADVDVIFADFTLNGAAAVTEPFRWRIQDVGAPQFQLEVRALDELLERTAGSGYRFLSIDARPIRRPFGRFVFFYDSDDILVEYAEPAAP
jgi:catechol 2,3-dioxygenase-like lactoylglutathione lyase family enzyme